MTLPPDEKQEFTHQAKRGAEMADIHWKALEETSLPLELRIELLTIWWRAMYTPKLEIPDFSKLLTRNEDKEAE